MNERLNRHRYRVSGFVLVTAILAYGGLAWHQAPLRAQVPDRAAAAHPTSGCARCHTCAAPRPDHPCLPMCTRAEAATEAFMQQHGPDFVLLDMIRSEAEGTDRFGPVPFDHAGHAEFAAITDGCVICHHYTPERQAHPACRTCHPAELRRDDIQRPSLKGAYHRQCLGCHREWSHSTECGACHIERIGEEPGIITREDALGHMTPPIPEPETEIYEASAEPESGTKVIFRHAEHIHRFGFKCAECHRGDNCMRCHEAGKQHVQKDRSLGEQHEDCSTCHATDVAEGGNCERCHWKEGQSRPAAFDHAVTGWPLSRYHKDNNCRDCHKELPFAPLDRTCTTCHADWEAGTFDHAVTGQKLDENHAEFDCTDCHEDGAFDKPPVCTECHDEDEGVAFPAQRPGPVVQP
jgi:hypothetical protein